MNISFLASLPRSGGTLLSSILSENSNIITTGNSPLAQLMWDAQATFQNLEQSVNYSNLQYKYLSTIPYIMYGDTKSHILDKSATWGLPGNINMIKKYITEQPKFIVTARPLIEIIKSIVYIRKLNNWFNPEIGLLDDENNSIVQSCFSVKNLIEKKDVDVLFIKYNDLVNNTQESVDKVYDFLGLEKFTHNFLNIKNRNPENDKAIHLAGLHDIRPTISKRNIDVKISKELEEKVNYLDLYTQIK